MLCRLNVWASKGGLSERHPSYHGVRLRRERAAQLADKCAPAAPARLPSTCPSYWWSPHTPSRRPQPLNSPINQVTGDRVKERRATRGLAAAARMQGQLRQAVKHLERVLEVRTPCCC